MTDHPGPAGTAWTAAPELLTDPAIAVRLASTLADELRPSRPDLVVVQDDVEDAVLGHAVAHLLGCRLTRIVLDEGILLVEGPLDAGARVALVGVDLRLDRVAALHALITRRGARIVGTAAPEPRR